MFLEFLSYILAKCVFFCSSIGADAFPEPLSKAEESRLLKESKKGNKQARDELISHNLRLVAHIAKKYQGAYDNDDLISVGTIGLIKAINTFEEGKGTQLATYTARCIENEILMLLRADKKNRNTLSLSDVIGADKDGNELTLIDLLAVDDESVFSQVEKTVKSGKLNELLKRTLTQREYRVIVLRFGLNGNPPLPQREVSRLLKISRSYISRIEKKAILKLRQEINNDDYFL